MTVKSGSEPLRSFGLGLLGLTLVSAGWIFFNGSTTELMSVSSGTVRTHSSPRENRRAAERSSSSPAIESIPSVQGSVAFTRFEKPATEDPGQALAEALQETDPERRLRLITTILKAWAATEPEAAARAALAWPGSDRVEPVAAVLAGAAQRPDDALRLGTFFCREDPGWAPEHGRALIAALSEAGHFSAAVSFALAGGSEVEGEERSKWLTAAFSAWAQREPRLAALAATNDLPESGLQEEAVIAVVARWRQLNPGGLEKFISQLPAGPERTALSTALTAASARE